MDLPCPRCRYHVNRMPLSEVFSKKEFIEFYSEARKELSGIVKGSYWWVIRISSSVRQ